jgi:hypothetical protein
MKKDVFICGLICLLVFLLITLEVKVKSEESIQMIHIMQLPDLHEIDLNFPCQLFIQEGDEQKVAIEGNSAIINRTGQKVKEGKLIMRQRNFWSFFKHEKTDGDLINIYVTLTSIENISINSKHGENGKGYNAGDRLNMRIGNSGAVIVIKSLRS